MCYGTWSRSVASFDCVAIHPNQSLMQFEELAAILEEVAGLSLAVMLVDVEVHRTWPGQFILNGTCGCLLASAALPHLRGFPGVAVSAATVSAVAVVVASIGVAGYDHVDVIAIVVDAHMTFAPAVAYEFCFLVRVNAILH